MIPVVLTLLFGQALGQLTLPAHFNWTDCGPRDRLIHIENLQIGPVPFKYPGVMTVSLDGTIDGTFGTDTQMDVHIIRWTLGQWANMPCFGNVYLGSCHYDNPCDLLKNFTTNGCPHQLVDNGLPCTCPFSPGRLHMSREIFNVTQILLMPTIFGEIPLEGTYRYHLELKRAGQIIGCLGFDITFIRAPTSGFLFG